MSENAMTQEQKVNLMDAILGGDLSPDARDAAIRTIVIRKVDNKYWQRILLLIKLPVQAVQFIVAASKFHFNLPKQQRGVKAYFQLMTGVLIESVWTPFKFEWDLEQNTAALAELTIGLANRADFEMKINAESEASGK